MPIEIADAPSLTPAEAAALFAAMHHPSRITLPTNPTNGTAGSKFRVHSRVIHCVNDGGGGVGGVEIFNQADTEIVAVLHTGQWYAVEGHYRIRNAGLPNPIAGPGPDAEVLALLLI